MKQRDYYDKLLELSDALPSGRNDKNCMYKLEREQAELSQAIEAYDTLGAIMEAGDVAYYAVKAAANALITYQATASTILDAAHRVGLTSAQVLQVAICKMTLRARPGNPKNDAAERAAVSALLAEWGL